MKKVSELTDNERYGFFLKEINVNKEVWLLHASAGLYAMLEDNNDNQYIPVWPAESDAKAFIDEDWSEYTTDRMGIGEFLEWLKELNEDDIFIAVFPVLNKEIIPMKPMDLRKHLEMEK